MVTTRLNLNLDEEVTRLERELRLYKNLKLTNIERRINELLDQLEDPATPQTKGQRLRERLGIIAATVALTAMTQANFEIPLFQQTPKQEQVSPKFSSSSAPNLSKPSSPKAPTLTKSEAKPETKPSLERLVKAIATQESNGNPQSINPDTGATGKWQVMPSNIPSWSKAALGQEVSHAEFLNSPQVQATIVKHRLNLYLNQQSKPGRSIKETIQRVAAAWYSGNPELWNHTKPQFSNGRKYPSIASYTQSVWDLYESQKPSVLDKTREIINTWSPQFQQDPQPGDVIAGYPVSSARGMRMSPTAGIMKMHQGVDLATPVGTPIYAIADGQIECDQWSDAGIVALFTSDKFPGLRFDLLHLDSCIAKPGSKLQVKQGEQIGTTGTWGTGPHLHLAIKSEASGKFLRVRAGWLYWFVSGKEPK